MAELGGPVRETRRSLLAATPALAFAIAFGYLIRPLPSAAGDPAATPAVAKQSATLTLRLPPPATHWREKDVSEDTSDLFVPEGANLDSLLDSPAYWRKFPPDRVIHATSGARDIKIVIEGDSAAHTISMSVAHGDRWTRTWVVQHKKGAKQSVTRWDLRGPQGDRVSPGTYTVMASSTGRGGEGGLILIGR